MHTHIQWLVSPHSRPSSIVDVAGAAVSNGVDVVAGANWIREKSLLGSVLFRRGSVSQTWNLQWTEYSTRGRDALVMNENNQLLSTT